MEWENPAEREAYFGWVVQCHCERCCGIWASSRKNDWDGYGVIFSRFHSTKLYGSQRVVSFFTGTKTSGGKKVILSKRFWLDKNRGVTPRRAISIPHCYIWICSDSHTFYIRPTRCTFSATRLKSAYFDSFIWATPPCIQRVLLSTNQAASISIRTSIQRDVSKVLLRTDNRFKNYLHRRKQVDILAWNNIHKKQSRWSIFRVPKWKWLAQATKIVRNRNIVCSPACIGCYCFWVFENVNYHCVSEGQLQ